MAKSKQKGNANEHAVAKIFTEWSGLEFHKMPASGALRWGNSTWTFGDLIPPENFPVVIECKHWHDVSVEEMLGAQKNPPGSGRIVEWWQQAVRDSIRCTELLGIHSEPLLVWKRDYGRHRICLRVEFLMNFLIEIIRELQFLTSEFGLEKEFALLDLKHFLSIVSFSSFCENLLKFI